MQPRGAPASERAWAAHHPEHSAAGRDALGRPAPGRRGARAAAFGSRVIIMDEPTAALGVKKSRKVLELMLTSKSAACRSS